jgi:ankyrin repeat protein
MPKQRKKNKEEVDEDFDDMLAEFQVADLTTASIAASLPVASSSSSIARVAVHPSTASLFNAAGWIVSEDAIVDACMSGNLLQLRRWGCQGVRVRTTEPLRQSAHSGASFDILSCLVNELCADVNQRDEHGFTALAAAAYSGQHHIVRYMVEELGADVNSQAYAGATSLYMAAMRGHLVVVRTLLNVGANIDRSNNEGITPLIVASSEKHSEIVKWLVKAGANTQTHLHDDPRSTAALTSRACGASAEQTAYLEAKTHCSNPGCSGAGLKNFKCTGCKQVRYCREACQLAHWKAHKADCRRWKLAAGKDHQ